MTFLQAGHNASGFLWTLPAAPALCRNRPLRMNICEGTGANLIDSQCMARIIFRELPAVAEVERQLGLHARDRLLDDDIEELPHLIDDASRKLFGITVRDTYFWALPDSIRAQYGRVEWEGNFDVLGHYSRDPNAYWLSLIHI